MTTALCLHCKIRPGKMARGLCWKCTEAPGVRDKYPLTSNYTRRGVEDFCRLAPLPPEPTTAVPGSAEKIEVIAARVKRGLAAHHPGDRAADLS